MTEVLIVYLPSPPGLNVFRDWAGGYGTALESARDYSGHDQEYFDVPYLPFLYIARLLEQQGITCHYQNLQHEERFDFEAFLNTIRQEQPQIVLTALSLPSLEHDLRVLKMFKERVPLRIVLSGLIANLFRERILQERYADYIIMKHEEVVTPAVIVSLLQGNDTPDGAWNWEHDALAGQPSVLSMQDLNDVDFPAYDMLDFSWYESSYPFGQPMRYTTLLSSKGCPYPCLYCPYPGGFGKKVLYREPERVIADIERLVTDFGVELLVFRDQVLTLNRAHCEALFQGMIEKNLPVVWLCETRYDLVDKDLLELMYRAGCREINYGLETADEELFQAMGKSQAKKGLDYFGRIIQETKEAGMTCHTHLMLGLPDDNWKSIKKTIRFLKTYRSDSVQVAIFIPYPGTPLGEDLKQQGLLDDNPDYQDYTGFKAVVPTKYMSIGEINEARSYIYSVWNQTLLTRGTRKIKFWISRLTNSSHV